MNLLLSGCARKESRKRRGADQPAMAFQPRRARGITKEILGICLRVTSCPSWLMNELIFRFTPLQNLPERRAPVAVLRLLFCTQLSKSLINRRKEKHGDRSQSHSCRAAHRESLPLPVRETFLTCAHPAPLRLRTRTSPVLFFGGTFFNSRNSRALFAPSSVFSSAR